MGNLWCDGRRPRLLLLRKTERSRTRRWVRLRNSCRESSGLIYAHEAEITAAGRVGYMYDMHIEYEVITMLLAFFGR